MKPRVVLVIFGVLGVFSIASARVLAMTSTNYQILWDSINSGGEDTSTSTNWRIRDTIGEIATGSSTSETYKLSAGYRIGDTQDSMLQFSIGTQENSTETAYSAFSNSNKTVTVSATSSFSVGNFIGVVENKGLSQLVAIGKITDISGAVITVDAWEGVPSSLSASPTGSDDFVYRLGGNQSDFGVRSLTAGKTSLTYTNILTNAPSGYQVSITTDGDLRYGNAAIINVADGAVTAGVEEFGAKTVGTTAQGTGGDFALSSTSTRVIQSSTTFASNDRIGLIYKFSAAASTPAGTYNQIVTYTATANF